MTLAEMIYQKSLELPDDKAQEVIDFIEFLQARSASGSRDPITEAEREARRRRAWERLKEVRIPWGGKPIPDRVELYDDVRGSTH